MKLLIVAGTLAAEGMGRFAHGLVEGISQRYPDICITLLAPKHPGDFHVSERCKVIVVPDLYRVRSFLHVREYMNIVAKESVHADIVHFATDFPNYLLGALRVRAPYIITSHGTYTVIGLTRGFRKYFIRRAFRNAAGIHAVSNFTARKLGSLVSGLQEPRVITHGIIMPTESSSARGDQMPVGRFILSAGGVKPRKGLHIGIEAFASVAMKYPDVRYYIIGHLSQKEYVEDLKGIVAHHKLNDRVIFLGHVSESRLQDLFRNCEVYLQPSITEPSAFEGYGIVFLEAGCYHKPVIATRGSGIEDAVIDRQTGLLVDQNDTNGTAQALQRLLGDRELAQRLGEGNFKKSYNQRWEVVAERFHDLYTSVLHS